MSALMTRRRLIAGMHAAAWWGCAGSAWSATAGSGDYPSRLIKVVVPFPAGALTDTLGRQFAERLQTTFAQPVVVENRPGAGTLTGAGWVAKGPADGYQLLVATTTTLAISPAMFPAPAVAASDFTGVAMLGSVSLLLVTRPDLKVRSLPDLIALIRREPGRYNFGSPGIGTMHQLIMEMIKAQEKLDVTHVPYQGSVAAMTDILGGRLDFMFLDIVAALPQVKAGKLNAIAIAASRRLPALPAVQTVAEVFPSIDMQAWQSIVAPKDTPPAIVAKLNEAANKQLGTPENEKSMLAIGVVPNPMSTDALNKLIASDAARFGDLVRRLGLRAT